MRIGVIGLGRMGAAMAATLARAGHEVAGHDTDAGARERAGERVGVVETVADLAGREAVVLSLPDARAVAAALDALEAARALPGLVIDTSTVEPSASLAMHARLAAAGVSAVDAPVSGGPAGAEAGTLAMMVGGTEAAVAAGGPILDALGGRIVRCGAPGNGHAVKLVNNFLVAAHLGAARVALRMGGGLGLETTALLGAINAGSGRSAVTEVNALRWIASGAFDSGFSAGLMRKDLHLAADTAEALGLDEPFLAAVAALWADPSVADTDDFNRIADPRGAR